MAANEKVGIEIELIGGEEAHRLLQSLDNDIDRLNKRKAFRSLSGLNKSKAELQGYINELERLKKTQAVAERTGKKFMATNTAKRIAETTAKIKEMSKAYDEATTKSKTFWQTMKSYSSSIAHFGSAMQSLGNALTRLTSPFRRLTTGLLYGAGFKALNLFTEGLSNSFERADTMRNYDRALTALGLDVKKTFSIAGKEAKTAKENLDDAVQGLPTSLDEIMAKQKIYAGATGEMVESTKTAIAANNTALASGMDARSQLFMQRYLTALSSGAELTTTQWQSMARIAPLAMRQVAKELGYADKEYAQFNKDVQSGIVSGQEFLKAFKKVGVSGAVADAARAQTESWGGLFANIRIAVTRMGAGILDTLNETFKDATGRTLLQRLLGWDANGKDLQDGVKAWINDLSESIQNWIKSNPDKIVEFFDKLKEIDVKGLFKGIAEGVGEFANVMGFFVDLASQGDLEKYGKWLVRLSMAGRALTILGGVLKGTRHLGGFLGAGGKWLAGKLAGKGIFGKIASIFGSKKAIESAGDAAKSVPKVSDTFRNAFKALEGLIKAAGAVLIVGTTGMIAFKEVKEMLKDLKAIGEILDEMDWIDAVTGIDIALGITALTKAFEAIGEAIGPDGALNIAIAGLSELIVGGTLWGMTAEVKGMFKELKTTVDTFIDIANELSGFEVPDIDVSGIVGTINKINTIYAYLSGEGIQQRGILGTAGKVMGFFKNPVQSLANGLAGGARKAVDAKSTATKFGAILDAIRSLKKIASEVNSLGSVTISEGAISNTEAIIGAVSDIRAKMAVLTKGTKGSKNLATNTGNLAKAFSQMQKMANRINKLAGTSVDKSGFATFVSNLKDAVAELDALDKTLELDIEVKLSPKFQDSVASTITSINNAKKKINDAAKKGITARIPVSITFAVTTNFASVLADLLSKRARLRALSGSLGGSLTHSSAGSAYGGSTPWDHAMGGLIYRAKGGNVPFRRRGTDTVPAMLTPGEFVHNKQAVNAFGLEFMRKVNNLDVRGAMSELMHRAGGMANVNRGTVITNNYNNQRVTINNNNPTGAGYTFKSASRFVGAL